MVEIKSRIRKWGNSFGIVVPLSAVRGENIVEGDDVDIIINKAGGNVLRETFGIMKFKKSTKEILDESDKESWDE